MMLLIPKASMFDIKVVFAFMGLVLLAAGDSSVYVPTNCCVTGKLNENAFIPSSCSLICVEENDVVLSNCIGENTAGVLGRVLMANSVDVRNCAGMALFPKLTTLSPADGMPAVFLESLKISDKESFESLNEINLDKWHDRCVSWEDLIVLSNVTIVRSVRDRLKAVAEKALSGCDKIVGKRYGNIMIFGYRFTLTEKNSFYVRVFFTSCTFLTVISVVALVLYIVYSCNSYRVLRSVMKEGQIMKANIDVLKAYDERMLNLIKQIDFFHDKRDDRMLTLYSLAKDVADLGNAQDEEARRKKVHLAKRISDARARYIQKLRQREANMHND